MADIALTNVIRKTTDILANLLVEEFTRLYWLREDIEWIQREMRRIQEFLKDADAKEAKSHGMANLESDIKELADDAEDIIDTYLPLVQKQKRKRFLRYLQYLVCNLCDHYANHKLVMEIASIKRRVKEINDARATYSITDNINSTTERTEELGRPRRIFHHVDQPVIVGFESHVEELSVKLLDPEIHPGIISITGMPGVGKTMLAKQVYDSTKENFGCCAWVNVSQKPIVRNILLEISRQVQERERKEKSKENNADMEANLYEFLKEKKYLIVLDDIWNTETWDALKNGIPNSSIKGSRLILTSRTEDVGIYAGGESNLHKLLPLSDEDSWELFSKLVKLPQENPDEHNTSPELRDAGKHISRRCGGLPLAIVVMAGLLLQKEREEGKEHIWKSVLNRMDQQNVQISKILTLSYRDLPCDMKPCFLYFGHFPEDHEFTVTELTSLWVAEGFISDEEGQDYVMELINRNLIQIATRKSDGRIRSCRIHDVLHSFCISIAKENNFFRTCHGDYSDIDTRVRRISIHPGTSGNIPRTRISPKLQALLVFNNEEEGREHLEHIHEYTLIRVLRLEGLVFQSRFPCTIGNLIHLKYLRLKGSSLRSLPSTISNLRHLHTIDVQQCENIILPAIIWKMQELRHLLSSPTTSFQHPLQLAQELRDLLLSPTTSFQHPLRRAQDKCLPKLIRDVSLPNLQSLYTLNGDFLKANCLLELGNLRKLGLCCSMKQFAKVLTDGKPISQTLETFHLEVRDDSDCSVRQSEEIPPLNFSGYQNLGTLYLQGSLMRLPEFAASLTKLTLVKCKLTQDPMEELGKLRNLKKLQLRRKSYMGFEMVASGVDSFPRLEVLIIEKMPSLRVLKVEEGVMPRLRCAKINFIVTLDIHSERLRNIFNEFNSYLMPMLELEVDFRLPEDDFFWDEDDSIMPAEHAEQEIVEVRKGFFGNPLEIGQSSSSQAPEMKPSNCTMCSFL